MRIPRKCERCQGSLPPPPPRLSSHPLQLDPASQSLSPRSTPSSPIPLPLPPPSYLFFQRLSPRHTIHCSLRLFPPMAARFSTIRPTCSVSDNPRAPQPRGLWSPFLQSRARQGKGAFKSCHCHSLECSYVSGDSSAQPSSLPSKYKACGQQDSISEPLG